MWDKESDEKRSWFVPQVARAGDVGKGFAVVADEVRLAMQTAKATREIASHVATIQGTTGEVMNALRAISRTIGEMSEIATGIAGANGAERHDAGDRKQQRPRARGR